MPFLHKLLIKFSILLAIYLFIVNYAFSQCQGTLVWSDEFSGASLDLTKWTYDIGNGCPSLCGWGNSELEYYTNSTNNVRTVGGNLIIEARSESMGGSSFTSGKIKTLGLASWTYGRFESRIRLPQGRGLWPAFWMLSIVNDWPMTGEIDIMEYRGDLTTQTNGTLHYGSPWPNNQWDGSEYFLPSGNFYSEWHVFAVEWDANEIRWFVDSIRFKTETRVPNSLNPPSTDNPWPWTSDFYIIMNLAVGGWYTGVTDPADVQLIKPTLEVDYVRVYDISTSTAYQSPYWGIPKDIPSKIEAEEFDRGCGDAAFYDTELANQGGQFRQEKVDIEATTDAGAGYDVGWMNTGEWLEYTINVPAGGTYDFTVRAASGVGGGRLRIEIDGVNVTGAINIPSTGGWQNWQNFTVSNVALTTGVKIMRVYVENTGLNLNYINVVTNTLPVDFSYFNLERLNNDLVKLDWETASEKNNSHFVIEKTIDGSTWQSIGEVKGANNSQALLKYSFSDEDPFTGLSFYRIKQVDHDGQSGYSKVLQTSSSENYSEPLINISDGLIVITDPYSAIEEISLIESTGKQVNIHLMKEADGFHIQTDHVKPGIYFLYLVSKENVFVKKIFL